MLPSLCPCAHPEHLAVLMEPPAASPPPNACMGDSSSAPRDPPGTLQSPLPLQAVAWGEAEHGEEEEEEEKAVPAPRVCLASWLPGWQAAGGGEKLSGRVVAAWLAVGMAQLCEWHSTMWGGKGQGVAAIRGCQLLRDAGPHAGMQVSMPGMQPGHACAVLPAA